MKNSAKLTWITRLNPSGMWFWLIYPTIYNIQFITNACKSFSLLYLEWFVYHTEDLWFQQMQLPVFPGSANSHEQLQLDTNKYPKEQTPNKWDIKSTSNCINQIICLDFENKNG